MEQAEHHADQEAGHQFRVVAADLFGLGVLFQPVGQAEDAVEFLRAVMSREAGVVRDAAGEQFLFVPDLQAELGDQVTLIPEFQRGGVALLLRPPAPTSGPVKSGSPRPS